MLWPLMAFSGVLVLQLTNLAFAGYGSSAVYRITFPGLMNSEGSQRNYVSQAAAVGAGGKTSEGGPRCGWTGAYNGERSLDGTPTDNSSGVACAMARAIRNSHQSMSERLTGFVQCCMILKILLVEQRRGNVVHTVCCFDLLKDASSNSKQNSSANIFNRYYLVRLYRRLLIK